ncbi:large conductance mechanosensitive channel protein MscL [Pseudonocardia nematodicida]|uniref:Large-conductance mechanosensitive channel n=1 Tax=Pseudonocardia nematodicida TaxID=1206997 RepID=A0ABV1K9F4_9PSEU
MLKGFKEFLLRGNVIDLAVAVVIGAAFTAVVTSFTRSFLEPLLRLFSGGTDAIPPGTIPLTDAVQLDYASFLNAIITFLITAAVIYFLVVFPMKWLQERRILGKEEEVPPTDSELLTEIRDLLRAQAERDAARSATPGRGPGDPFGVPPAPGSDAVARVPGGYPGGHPGGPVRQPYPDTPMGAPGGPGAPVPPRHAR